MRSALVLALALSVAGCAPAQLPTPPNAPSGAGLDAEVELAARQLTGRSVVRDVDSASAILQRATQQGNLTAQLITGRILVNAGKAKDGVALVKLAATQGLAEAQADLAWLYFDGKHLERDLGEALRLAKAAAAQGNVDGSMTTGRILALDSNPARDFPQALAAVQQAADRGNTEALWYLARAHATGRGTAVDPLLAYVWSDIGFRRLDGASKERAMAARLRDDAALLLLPHERDLGRKLAMTWNPGDDLAARRADPSLMALATPADWVFEMPKFAEEPRTKDIPVSWLTESIDVTVRLDGTSTTLMESQTRPNNKAAIRTVGERRLTYDEQLDSVEILEAATVKPDGRRMAVPAGSIFTRPLEQTGNLPMFSDLREKVVVYPAVDAGDILVFRTRKVHKPTVPGLFSYTLPFNRFFAQDSVKIRITVPKTMPLHTETYGMEFKRSEQGNTLVYEWNWANPTPLMPFATVLDPLDWAPRFAASNFTDWDQLAQAYGKLIEPKLVVTPKVRQLAEDITHGITDRRAQAEALYNWVSHRIRYVAIDLGNHGGMQPHAPDDVIVNSYGDCKDHSALLTALLRAKGIASEVVLINATHGYTLSGPPTFSSLNHAITYLPEFSLYVDSTIGVAPFGVLSFAEYGKPVIHSGQPNPVRRIPTLASGAASFTLRSAARLDQDGKISGATEMTGTGPFAVALRGIATDIEAEGNEQAAKAVLGRDGLEGTGKYTIEPPETKAGDTYRLGGNFQARLSSGTLAGNGFNMPAGLWLGWQTGDVLAGPLSLAGLPDMAPTPCYLGRQSIEISLELPPGKRLRDLPKGADIRTSAFHYISKWSQTDRTVTLNRRFISTNDTPLCITDRRREMAEGLAKVRADYGVTLSLTDM